MIFYLNYRKKHNMKTRNLHNLLDIRSIAGCSCDGTHVYSWVVPQRYLRLENIRNTCCRSQVLHYIRNNLSVFKQCATRTTYKLTYKFHVSSCCMHAISTMYIVAPQILHPESSQQDFAAC